MPKKLDDCVKKVMAQGKSESEAFAICKANFNDKKTCYEGSFTDSATWSANEKTAISVRDGVLEYYGHEIGLEPVDKIFTIYRSPATIANAAKLIDGIPLTNDHVSLDEPVTDSFGSVIDGKMVDLIDESTSSHVGVQNRIKVDDDVIELLDSGVRELSLGYKADLVPHDKYDFEQRSILPLHLAVVERGRCGASCSFLDKKPQSEGNEMPKATQPNGNKPNAQKTKLSQIFSDAEGQPSLEKIVQIAQEVPEALKSLPMDKIVEVMPTLQEIVNFAAENGAEMPKQESEGEEEAEETEEKVEIEDGQMYEDGKGVPLEQSKKFNDALGKRLAIACKEHAQVIEKARDFVGEDYSFTDKSTKQIMTDAVKSEHGNVNFNDSELSIAFKMLKPQGSNLKKFGDSAPSENRFAHLADKEI